jgi:homoserine acetyltransferase
MSRQPIWWLDLGPLRTPQQREIATTLKRTGNKNVTHIELGEEKSLFGHDTFLLDLQNVGGAVKSFLG